MKLKGTLVVPLTGIMSEVLQVPTSQVPLTLIDEAKVVSEMAKLRTRGPK